MTMGLTRIGLFGTRFTMQGNFYTNIFERQHISLVVPGLDEQTYLHDQDMNEFVRGIYVPETCTHLLAMITPLKTGSLGIGVEGNHGKSQRALKTQEGIQGLILGGTELSLILREETYEGVAILDTTRIHAEQAVAQLLK